MMIYTVWVITIGGLFLTGLIFFLILRVRYYSNKENRQRQRTYAKMETYLLSLFADEILPHQWAIRVRSHELGYLQDFLLPYLVSLKGEWFEKLVAVAHHSGLVKHLLQEGRSTEAWKQAQAIYPAFPRNYT